MTSITQDLRGALQLRAATAVGFPPAGQRAYDDVFFEATLGTPWARMTFMPQSGRAFSVSAGTKQHVGLFQVDLFYPPNSGTAAAEIVADAVKAVFQPGTRLVQGAETVIIDYAERNQGLPQADWYGVPVTIRYRAFSSRN